MERYAESLFNSHTFGKNFSQVLMFSVLAPIRQIDASGGMEMTIRTRVSQDRRNTSRIIARLNCHFTFEEVSHEAVIVDLSLKGAYISAKSLPPNGSNIRVAIQPPDLKKEMVFNATVTRGTWATSENGKLGRFGIRFGAVSPDLMNLIRELNS